MKNIWQSISQQTEVLGAAQSDSTEFLMSRPCPICKSNLSKTVLTLDRFQFYSDSTIVNKQIDVVQEQCERCYTLYMNPCYSPAGFAMLISEVGHSYGSTEGRPYEQIDWMKQFGLLITGYSVMDIGCFQGHFLSLLPKQIKKIGVDIDQKTLDAAKLNHPDIEFICDNLSAFNYTEPVDVITMFHVLEHLSEPLETLQKLHSIASDTTHLLVEVPLIDNGHTNDINGFLTVHHLTHFSRNSFRNCLIIAGWEVVQWDEQTDYNGCRVLAKKAKAQPVLQTKCADVTLLYSYMASWYQALLAVEKKIQTLHSSTFIIWGAGTHLEFLYQVTSLFKKEAEWIVIDNDPNKQNKRWRGLTMHSPEILNDLQEENTPVIVSSYGSQENILHALLEKKISRDRIVLLYDDVRIC